MPTSTRQLSEVAGFAPKFYTPRLHLRQPGEADIPAIIRIAGDPEIARRLTRMPHPYGPDDARFFLDVVVKSELVWAIVDCGSGVSVGVIGLAPENDTVSLGYYVAREHWGAGIASEAASVVIAYAIGLVGAERITAKYFADNPASGRVLQKLGFAPSGTSSEISLATGERKEAICVRLAP